MRFKQICNHPSQWLGDGSWVEADSGKLSRLRDIAEVIAAKQEKVLVFTQFREATRPLPHSSAPSSVAPGLVLHGGTPVKQRKDLVRRFRDDDNARSSCSRVKAGGTGLNLTGASHVIHFDRWWNPSVENQATDRAFRMGNTNVLVHKFVCRGTVEDKIDRLIESKKQLAGDFLSAGAGHAADRDEGRGITQACRSRSKCRDEGGSWMSYFGWRPYVPVAEKRRQAECKLAKLKKQRQSIAPVKIEGRTIAKSFWGKSWCGNLERYSDYENRLPRGRTYVRNGSVVDLKITKGEVAALVSGSELYKVKIAIKPVTATRWKAICRDCAGTINSLVELLEGRLAKGVMDRICREGDGLFPAPGEIQLSCNCLQIGRHVQACCGGALWCRCAARRNASPTFCAARRR